ncbi:MAG: threonylcarbamoyl-AMP synthase [Oligoflexales bacterium]|nr:threonylcarbamoyl-AMP synthase [Oligoflexales bacterium]
MNEIWKLSELSLKASADFIRKGGVCAIGTETVYGLAADFGNSDAIKKIFHLKKRPLHNPLIVHCKAAWSDLETLIEKGLISKNNDPKWADVYKKVIERFPEGPLTFLMPRGPKISDLITAGSPLVAIRRPHNCAMARLLDLLEMPVVAPSANMYQQLSPTSAQMVDAQFKNREFPIVDSGNCQEGIESTVVSIHEDTLTIHRMGPITAEELKACGIKLSQQVSTHKASPGQDKKHYSPKTPLYLAENLDGAQLGCSPEKTGFLVFQEKPLNLPHAVNLGKDAKIAAHKLYRSLYEFDQKALTKIVVIIPEGSCFQAIRDKLKRAAHKGSAEA